MRDFGQLGGEICGEIWRRFKAGKTGKTRERLGRHRQGLRLFVLAHLQAMLEAAQIIIALGQRAGGLVGNPIFIGQHGQHVDRAMAAQICISPARDELLGLHEELNLTNAAAPQF